MAQPLQAVLTLRPCQQQAATIAYGVSMPGRTVQLSSGWLSASHVISIHRISPDEPRWDGLHGYMDGLQGGSM